MNSLEGANCADLPGFVIDKYFNASSTKEPLHTRVGLAICRNCVVLDACREQAMNMAGLPERGVIGGVTVSAIRRARSWRAYELGYSEDVPNVRRPTWLKRPDAAETVEEGRIEADPDEPTTQR